LQKNLKTFSFFSTFDLDFAMSADDEEAARMAAAYQKRRGRRTAISAAPPSSSVSSGSWQKKVIPKTADELSRIAAVIDASILFAHLGAEEKKIIMDAMFEVKVSAEERIIKQGDEGDNFYIIDSGTCQCFVDGVGLVLTCNEGDSFGELALMYDAPRAATVSAKTDCRLWAMDRETYKNVMMSSMMDKRSRYSKFLENVPFMETLDKYERSKVADFLVPRQYRCGDVIVRQGDSGDEFFIVSKGRVRCTQAYDEQGETKQGVLCELGVGQYFGEIALLQNTARKATVAAIEEPTECLVLSGETFTLAMGPLLGYLKRNASLYKTYREMME
jgi:cAMP-dependent protein kinase regulator